MSNRPFASHGLKNPQDFSIKTYNEDCFNILPKLENNSVDMVLVDLPYGQTSARWDCVIDLDKMWIELKRVCKKKCNYVFFTTTKFGYDLIKSNPKWFRYDLVWAKSRKVGFLSANKMPLRRHEMVYIFGETTTNEEWNLSKDKYNELKDYSRYILKNVEIKDKSLKNLRFFKPEKKDFCLMRKNTYDKLIDKYNINKLEKYKSFDELKKLWNDGKDKKHIYNPQKTQGKPYKVKKRDTGIYGGEVEGYENKDGSRHPDSVLEYKEHEMVYIFGNKTGGKKTYNPQMVEGKPYKAKRGDADAGYYRKGEGATYKFKDIDNKGTRHPHTILEFNNPHRTIHKTQKPVDLCEWLIKSYSNEGDLVLDFTCGSGTTGVACINTKRKCILIEKDKDIFNKMDDRINKLIDNRSAHHH